MHLATLALLLPPPRHRARPGPDAGRRLAGTSAAPARRQLVERRRLAGAGRPGERRLHPVRRGEPRACTPTSAATPTKSRRSTASPTPPCRATSRSCRSTFYYADESDAGAPGRPAGYPIPEQAKTQPRWIEGGYPGAADPGGDRHLLLVDRDHRLLFELYDLHWDGTSAGPAARVPSGRSTATADAPRAGPAPTPPASRSSRASCATTRPTATTRSATPSGSPCGPRTATSSRRRTRRARPRARCRWGPACGSRRPRTSPASPPPLRQIFQAMKTYGLIVADNGSDLYVSGTYDTRWDNDLLNPAFAALEGLRLRGRPPRLAARGRPAVPPPDPSPASRTRRTLCLNRERFGVASSGPTTPVTRAPARLSAHHRLRPLLVLQRVEPGDAGEGDRRLRLQRAVLDLRRRDHRRRLYRQGDGLGDRGNLVAQQHPGARLPRLHRQLRLRCP